MTDKPTPTDAATPECLTCSDHGAVGNILTAEPCPDCTRWNVQPAQADSVQEDAALRLANVCSNLTRYSMDAHLIAAELRRQHAHITELESQLAQRFDAADMATASAQGDALDAVRYRFLRDGEWRGTDLEPFIRLQLNTLWDAKIDAARGPADGESNG